MTSRRHRCQKEDAVSDFSVDKKARCPHCGTTVQFAVGEANQLLAPRGFPTGYAIRWVQCPSCQNIVITLIRFEANGAHKETTIYPLGTLRSPVPPEVPTTIKADYDEAALILSLSPTGSAALSRRCLQAELVDAGGTKKKNLSEQIDEVTPKLPAYLEEVLDQVRVIGNFSAHPLKDTNSGVIVDVEPGEAEWNLDVLDDLFDFYYVKPAASKRKKDEVNQKLIAAGKPTI